jgi:hypothetical protein
MFKANQRVWVYEKSAPLLGTTINQIGGLKAWRIKLDYMSESQLKCVSEKNIYIYPDQRNLLVATMRDDAYYLNKYADEIELLKFSI